LEDDEMQDIFNFGAKHCYACIQWSGHRTVDEYKKTIRVDIHTDGRCLVKKQDVKGSSHCPEFFAIK
jgi:hypothetical protein